MITFDARGQQQPLKEQLFGTWTLLSWEQKKADGTKTERYGPSPKGIAFFDAGGRYIITVTRADRAKYASNALWQGTPEENKETADGTITYFGTYSMSEADGSIAIHVESSSFPNWNGTDQTRFVSIAGDQLTLTVRPPGWKRRRRDLEASEVIEPAKSVLGSELSDTMTPIEGNTRGYRCRKLH